MIILTPEQQIIKEYVTANEGIVLVSAGPGTGKTFMAERIIQELSPSRVLYTAFNKAIVEEAKERFGTYEVQCKTLHAVAYQYAKPHGEIRPTNYRDLPETLSYDLKYKILQELEKFLVSNSVDMWDYFENAFKTDRDKELLVHSATDVVNAMLDKKLPWSFSFLLKYFHLMLTENPSACCYDLVIMDEINDTTAVALEIFKLIKAPRKLGVGDPHQAIYSFLNLVNGFEELKDTPIYSLTHSFRCSKEIASRIENFMVKEVSPEIKFKGTDDPIANGKTLYCTMTNAAIVNELARCIRQRKQFLLLRKPSDIFACPLAVTSASNGKEVYQTQYKYLQDVYTDWKSSKKTKENFYGYLLTELNDQEIHSAVKLLLNLGKEINLFKLYNDVKQVEQGGDYTIATVYTSKGLEFETVILSDEFNTRIESARQGSTQIEDRLAICKCMYVACSRAGKYLLNAGTLDV